MIDMEYGDDIGKPTRNHCSIESLKHHISEVLEFRDLMINQDKTEPYKINRLTHEWRNCEFLGSMLDAHKDIKQRKFLAINPATECRLFSITKNSSQKHKSQLVEPISNLSSCATAKSWQ